MHENYFKSCGRAGGRTEISTLSPVVRGDGSGDPNMVFGDTLFPGVTERMH